MQNKTFTQTTIVATSQTAEEYGSGLLPVYATPALIGFMENTAMKMIELPADSSSVGILMNMKHLKASAVGATITCTATITEVDGRKYTFAIKAMDESGDVVGEAIHERFVVNVEKFMSKVK